MLGGHGMMADGLLMHFFLFFLASAMAAGLLDMVTCASMVDLGRAEGLEGIVGWGGGGPREKCMRQVWLFWRGLKGQWGNKGRELVLSCIV